MSNCKAIGVCWTPSHCGYLMWCIASASNALFIVRLLVVSLSFTVNEPKLVYTPTIHDSFNATPKRFKNSVKSLLVIYPCRENASAKLNCVNFCNVWHTIRTPTIFVNAKLFKSRDDTSVLQATQLAFPLYFRREKKRMREWETKVKKENVSMTKMVNKCRLKLWNHNQKFVTYFG